jgi:hypothetical protein
MSIAMVLVIGLAAWLRFQRLDLVEFKTDEGTNLRLAEDLMRLGRVPLVGMTSSVGAALPPAFIYFLAPAAALGRDPRIGSAAVAIANVAATAGILALGWRFFSPAGGFVAGLVFAANPWAVFYARKVWPQDIMAPWAVVLFWALDRAVVANSAKWAASTLPLFAIGVEIHFAFSLLAPLLFVPLALLVGQRRWSHLALGASAALLVTTPYAMYLMQTGLSDFGVLQERVTAPAMLDGQGAAQILGLTATWDQWYLVTLHLDRALAGRITATAANLSTLLLVLGVGVAVAARLVRSGTDRAARWRSGGLLLTLIAPAVLTIRHAIPLYDYYFLFVLPAAALLVGGGIHWLVGRPGAWQRGLFGLALGGVIVAASIQSLIVTRLLDHLAATYEPSYGQTLVASEALADEILEFGAETSSERAIFETPSPEGGALAYLVRPAFRTIELSKFGEVGLGFSSGTMPHAVETSVPSGELAPPRHVDLRYGDGIHLLFATATRELVAGHWIHLAACWQADNGASPTDALWEISLHDAAGLLVSRRPGIQHASKSIPPGVPTLSWFSLEIETGTPEAQYELRLRRVDVTTGQPMAFIDSTGQTGVEWRSPLAWRPG